MAYRLLIPCLPLYLNAQGIPAFWAANALCINFAPHHDEHGGGVGVFWMASLSLPPFYFPVGNNRQTAWAALSEFIFAWV
jgi:hypothetical protein